MHLIAGLHVHPWLKYSWMNQDNKFYGSWPSNQFLSCPAIKRMTYNNFSGISKSLRSYKVAQAGYVWSSSLFNISEESSWECWPKPYFSSCAVLPERWVAEWGGRERGREEEKMYHFLPHERVRTIIHLYVHTFLGKSDLHHWLRAAPGTGDMNALKFPYNPVHRLRQLWWCTYLPTSPPPTPVAESLLSPGCCLTYVHENSEC